MRHARDVGWFCGGGWWRVMSPLVAGTGGELVWLPGGFGGDSGETEVAVALWVACLPSTELGSDFCFRRECWSLWLDHSHGGRWSVCSGVGCSGRCRERPFLENSTACTMSNAKYPWHRLFGWCLGFLWNTFKQTSKSVMICSVGFKLAGSCSIPVHVLALDVPVALRGGRAFKHLWRV